jgi:hypothetical protein
MTRVERIEKLKRDIVATEKKQKALYAKLRAEEEGARRDVLQQQIGKPVKLCDFIHFGGMPERERPIYENYGTLLELRRTKATIDFGQHGKWNIPISSIKLPDETTLRTMPPLEGEQKGAA